MNLSSNRRIVLAIGLVASLVLALLITPLGGLETRTLRDTTPLGFLAVLGVIAGVVVNVASIVLLFRAGRARWAVISAILGMALYLPVLAVDQTGNFSARPAPAAIGSLELVMTVVVIVVLAYALWVYQSRHTIAG